MTPLVRHGQVKPAGAVTFRVLYLFAGRPRQAYFGGCLTAIAAAFNGSLPFDLSVATEVLEIDIRRGGNPHDLLRSAARAIFLADLRRGYFDALIAAPPCDTHTRARHSNFLGPPPLRSGEWPRGLSDLSPMPEEKVRRANVLSDYAITAMHAAVDADALVLLKFPEHLGATKQGMPASLWTDPRMREHEGKGAKRGAIDQDEWASVRYLRPTGLITNAPKSLGDSRLLPGLAHS